MIADDVLRASIPRLGTVTVGRGVLRQSQAGNDYSQPTRAKSLVFHTNDDAAADAILSTLGGRHHTDSPNYAHDVELDPGKTVPVMVLPFGWRQNMEDWRAAECRRRCDGLRMATVDGKPADEPCRCQIEMDTMGAQERTCSPHTVLPVLVDLDLARFGVWEVRSTAYGSARRLKGAIQALQMVGVTQAQVPGVLFTETVQTRDSTGKVWDVLELDVRIAADHHALAQLASSAPVRALDPPDLPALGNGDQPPEPTGDARAEEDEARARQALATDLRSLRESADEFGLRDVLAAAWAERHPDAERLGDLDLASLTAWVQYVRSTVDEAEERARAAAAAGPPKPPPPAGEDDVPF